MSSKQEKLAAARKKLKEFQGKHRESDILKQKNVPETEIIPVKSDEHFSHLLKRPSPSCTPISDGNKEYGEKYFSKNYVGGMTDQKVNFEDYKENYKTSNLYFKQLNSPTPCLEETQSDQHNFYDSFVNENAILVDKNKQFKPELEDSTNLSDYTKELSSIECKSTNSLKLNIDDTKNSYQSSDIQNLNDSLKDKFETASMHLNFQTNSQCLNTSIFPYKENIPFLENESRSFSNTNFSAKNDLDDKIKPLQTELENHAQTINILVQQRNEAQNALVHAQNLLSKKSEEMMQEKQQIMNLTLAVNDLNRRIAEADAVATNLTSENELRKQKIDETLKNFHSLKAQFDAKEEECLELKRKYDEKNKECQHLVLTLMETQNQLSLCQIQMQPLTDQSTIMHKITTLEDENLKFKQQIDHLQKQLQAEMSEKEQSSQNYKVYAQQCNTELERLNVELRELSIAYEELKQMNADLSSDLSDMEAKNKQIIPSENNESEIADIRGQISILAEEKIELHQKNQRLEGEISALKSALEEKEVELQKVKSLLTEVEIENKKLIIEAETPKADERLLAAIESDKIAAARAVSQNQKLKSQVVELEEAFVKLSEEKLELTDKLSHEKFLNKELQNRLDNLRSVDHHHDHHNHNDHSDCNSFDKEKLEPLINDSQEIEELKKIILQLQDDKVELKSRLNLITSQVNLKEMDHMTEKHLSEHEENEEEHQDAKFRLQQMEEKVRKTMNEVAILDEEKEKLEHLVLQLQGETETIGEYVTLYQKQRMLLNQRAQEKDNQLAQLFKDKEELKSKLLALDELVQHLLSEKNNSNLESDTSAPWNPSEKESSENTVGKIRTLISEIGSTNLVNSQSVAFKHCSCCSGRLITI